MIPRELRQNPHNRGLRTHLSFGDRDKERNNAESRVCEARLPPVWPKWVSRAPQRPKVRKLILTVPKLQNAVNGLTVVLLSAPGSLS